MTRKDYINIAGAFQATNARIQNDPLHPQLRNMATDLQLKGVRRLAAALADFLADDNPRFDKRQFLINCGYSGEVKATQPAVDSRKAWAEREETARAPRMRTVVEPIIDRQVWPEQSLVDLTTGDKGQTLRI